jgi:hypothetical protein
MSKRWGKVDFSELKALQKRLEEFDYEGRDEFCRKVSKELAARLIGRVKRRTPVGQKPKFNSPKTAKVTGASGKKKSFLTKEGEILQKYWSGYQGGTLRRGWTGGVEMPAETYAAGLKVKKVSGGFEIEVKNPVEYASYVEYGHRQQAGRYVLQIGKQLKSGWVLGKFMLKISEEQVQAMAPALLEKRLEEELRGILDGK